MDTIHIDLGKDSYDIFIDNGLTRSCGAKIATLTGAKKAVVLTEDEIDALYGRDLVKSLGAAGIEAKMIVIPSREKSRSLQVVNSVYGALVDFDLDSGDLLIALGGRIVGDVTGFVAATYHRGIQYIQFPTSVLSQIGSSIGGKITLDITAGKNLIGLFYQPRAIFIDPGMARTLPRRYLHNGLGEAVKLGCVADKELFELFEKSSSDSDLLRVLPEIIKRCVRIKARYVEKDPLAKAERRVLDFGHTIGGAIERRYRHDDMTVTHGEATAIGMYLMTKRSEILGLTKRGTADRLEYVLKALSLPTHTDLTEEQLLLAMHQDKKIHDNLIDISLLKEIGEGYVKTVLFDELVNYIKV